MIRLNRTKGIFISVESVEFGGKTTLINNLNIDNVVKTREPGGTEESEIVRSWLLSPKDSIFDNHKSRAAGYALARAFNIHQIVSPALNDGKLVISDRYIHSSLVLQGYLNNIDINKIAEINAFTCGFDKVEDMMPDYTIYIDITEEEMLRRASVRGILNELDDEFVPQFKIIRDYFLTFADNPNFIVFDGNGTIEEVQERFTKLINDIIEQHNK